MYGDLSCDEELVRRLPLPLARLYRHAHNAKSPFDRHQAAYYLWEAALKLLGSSAVVTVAQRGTPDPQLAEALQRLARPALGDWWALVRLLLPALAGAGDPGFRLARDLLLGRTRDDLPRAAGLDAALRETLDGSSGARVTVRLSELFDRMVRYRNREIGHGAAGRRPDEFYDRVGRAILLGGAEILGRLDVLAGRRLVHVAAVRRLPAGSWLVERFELVGESPRLLDPREQPEGESDHLPRPGLVYLESGADAVPIHPLLAYEPDGVRSFFLNARRGRSQAEYLDYESGEVQRRPDLGGERRELLARALGMPVGPDQFGRWADELPAEEEPAPERPDGPVRLVGEFELLSRLGRGGMGVVYRAWQPSVGRQVALKCLIRGDHVAEVRFAREIRVLGRVDHPNVVKIYTSGSDAVYWFYAMELVEGATLAEVHKNLVGLTPGGAVLDLSTWKDAVSLACQEARASEEPISDARPDEPAPARAARVGADGGTVAGPGHIHRAVELVRQVAEAAHALHAAGVLHRDIKPGNIMVSPEGEHAVLVDLGLAQLADAADGKLTRTRQFVGTLRYASPEQVMAVARVDGRSDVYSLGVTLWELLTLRPIYGATEAMPTPELIDHIQFDEPERVRPYNPAIPADLEAVVLKCLEKKPARRYQSARDLADDLGRWLRGERVRVPPVSWHYALGKFLRRRGRRVAVLTTIAASQVGLALALMRAGPAGSPDAGLVREAAYRRLIAAALQDDDREAARAADEFLAARPGPPESDAREPQVLALADQARQAPARRARDAAYARAVDAARSDDDAAVLRAAGEFRDARPEAGTDPRQPHVEELRRQALEAPGRRARDDAVRRMSDALARRDDPAALTAAEAFLSAPPPRARDPRTDPVLKRYHETFVRWFVRRQAPPDAETRARVDRYGELIAAVARREVQP